MIQKENETGLLAAAVQGNRDAYGQLVRKYQDRLLATVYRVVRSVPTPKICARRRSSRRTSTWARSRAAVRSIPGCAVLP